MLGFCGGSVFGRWRVCAVTGVGNIIVMGARHYGKYGLYIMTYPLRILSLAPGMGRGKCGCMRRMIRSAYGKYSSYTVIYPSNYLAICETGDRRWGYPADGVRGL